jgi:hypothetical protein
VFLNTLHHKDPKGAGSRGNPGFDNGIEAVFFGETNFNGRHVFFFVSNPLLGTGPEAVKRLFFGCFG